MAAISLLIKPASGRCNMGCRYCFYTDVTGLRERGDRGMMSLDTLEQVVRRALGEADTLCVIGFQGGEPTLAGLDFFRALIGFEQAHNPRGVPIRHALQTNGLRIDEEWAAFLAEHRFLTGLSIDGEKAVHDALRPDAAGKGTHSRALQAARLLRRAGADFNVLTVVTRQLAAHPDRAYNFYRREGLRYLQFIPCLDGLEEAHGSNPYSLSAESYGRFLCRIFDLWYEDFLRGEAVSVRVFDNYIHMLAGYPPENCAMAGVCSVNPLVEADGSVYPCDFYAVDRYLLGNVWERSFGEMGESRGAKAFLEDARHPPDGCRACDYASLCRGGCRRDCEPCHDGQRGPNDYCGAYKAFFRHTLPRMQRIAARLR